MDKDILTFLIVLGIIVFIAIIQTIRKKKKDKKLKEENRGFR